MSVNRFQVNENLVVVKLISLYKCPFLFFIYSAFKFKISIELKL